MNILVIDREYSTVRAIRDVLLRNLENVHVYYTKSAETAIEEFKIQVQKDLAETSENDSVHIDLTIISWEDISANAAQALDQLKTQIALYNTGSAESKEPFRFIFTAFDQASINPRSMLALKALDIIFKPIDDLLILQKIVTHCPSLRRDNQSNFLYTAETQFPVEIATDYQLIGTGTFGVQFKSKFSFKVGTKVKMYCSHMMKLAPEGLYASCLGSTPRSDGSFNCSFMFFGLNTNQLKLFREKAGPSKIKPVSEAKKEKPLPPIGGPGTETFKAIEAKHKILLVDMDVETINAVSDLVQRNFPDHDLEVCSSFRQVIEQLKGTSTTPDSSQQIKWDLRPAFSSQGPLVMHVNASTLQFARFPNFMTESSLVFGYPPQELRDEPTLWHKIVRPTDRPIFEDFLSYLTSGQKTSRKVKFISKAQTAHLVSVSGQLISYKDELVIELILQDITYTVSSENFVRSDEDKAIGGNIDAVIVDYSFVQNNPVLLTRHLCTTLKEVTGREAPPILFTAKSITTEGIARLATVPHVEELFMKPLDRSSFIHKLKVFIDSLTVPDAREKLEPFTPAEGWVDIARQVTTTNIGEYGLTVSFGAPLPVGGLLYIYHPELRDNTGRGALSRCILSTADADNRFLCSLLFLAVREEKLKNIRLLLAKIHPDKAS